MEEEKRRILIIEDTPELRKIEAQAFKNAGFFVDVASDGDDGIKKLKNNKYDLILMDIVMPNRTGFEVMNELKLIDEPTPIMIYSNLIEVVTKDEALKLGAKEYFEKVNTPLDFVVEKVKKFLS